MKLFLTAGFITASTLMTAAPTVAQNAQRHTLSEICTDASCAWEKVATCSGFIEGINFDDQGDLWMVGLFNGSVQKVEGDSCTIVGEPAGAPNGAKFGPDGNLIIADRLGSIQSLDLETGERTVLHSAIGTAAFRGLNDLSFASDGSFYFTEPYGSSALNKVGGVYYVGPQDGAQPEAIANNMAYPNGIAVSADGQTVFVAEFAENRILSLPSKMTQNPNDTPRVFARLEGGIGPDGMAVDAAGNLYVAHFGAGEVAIIDPNGFSYGTMPLPEGAGPFTTNVALHDGYLYVTEAMQNEVWRVAVKTAPLDVFAGQ
jgi:gluconolactonase